ncbi:MAG: cytochrome c nitrite reductase small subunit [Phycisphaeraceae bacterium]|nr:cytochrome c nitrite reductase small subunit [Phycisphaeraceae bacterium]
MKPSRSMGTAMTVLAALLGVFLGLGAFTFTYAEGWSYLSNDPAACVNCHVMNQQHRDWEHSSHHAWAVCNDCHVPHDSVVSKYATKADHGARHSWGFTFQTFHEPIQIKASSLAAVQENCVRCHEGMVSEIVRAGGGEAMDCVHCHRDVGHAR